jgi:hypothetical protein
MRLTTLASRPKPLEYVNARPLAVPRSIRRGLQVSAMASRCSVASTMSPGIPSILHSTFVAPPGRQVSGVAQPARPLATSLTVPSPPKETMTS